MSDNFHTSSGWVGVDLDGTLAEYDKWISAEHIGKPILTMVNRVKHWLEEGTDVRIFTARCWPLGTTAQVYDINKGRVQDALRAVDAIEKWCKEQFGVILPITCIKDYHMYMLWDDRAISVEKNTGRRV